MTDVRLTALNPVDSQVYPVACNTSGELLVADGGPDLTVTGDLTVNGIASFNDGDVNIDSSGRLLVRTSSAFETSADSIVQGLQASGARIALGRDDTTVSGNQTIGQLNFYGNATSGTYSQIGQIKCISDGTHSGTSRPTRLEFSTTADGASSPSERLTVDSSGNVAIGTNSADGTLHVQTASAGTVTAWGNADDLIIENDNNTGISILAADDKQANIIFGSPTDNIGSIIRWQHNTNELQIGTHKTGGFLTFRTAVNSEAMQIDSSGNVGINKQNPSAKLDVDGTGNFTGDVTAPNISTLMNAVVALTNRIAILEAN